MKILFINDYSTPGGGAEILTLNLLEGMRKRGHNAVLFSSTAVTSEERRFADYECYGTMSRFRTLSQTANLSAYYKLKALLKKFEPDVVHVHMFMTQLSPLLLPLLRDTPSLYHVHLYEAICPLATKCLPDESVCHFRSGLICHKTGCVPLRAMPAQLLRLYLFQKWRSSFDLFVAVSRRVKQFLIEEGIGPVEIIPNGIAVRSKRPPLENTPVVSFAGHLIPRKGVHVLIAAFAKVVSQRPEAKLLIAGDGPEKEKLIRMAHNLGISQNVTMLGWLPNSRLETEFGRAWVHVTPSIWEEPFGMSTLEAMMRGTAIVASSVGGQLDCVQEGRNGYLVPPNDPEQLAASLLRILLDRNLAESMGDQGREIALEQFTDSLFIDRFVEVYRRLVAPMEESTPPVSV